MLLSHAQLNKFWRLWARAERETLSVAATQAERDALRHSVIFKSCGKKSIKDVNPSRDFDALMGEVAIMTGDAQEMCYWCVASERRMCYMIAQCARQIGDIVQSQKGWEYCQAVFDQAGLPKCVDDIPEDQLTFVFKMLDTYRRRLLKRDHGWRGERFGQPLGFYPDRRYVFSGSFLRYDDQITQPATAKTA